MKRPCEIIILESRRINILKKDFWTVFECSLEICGHEFNIKTDQFSREFFSSLVQCHDHSWLVERELGVTLLENWHSEYGGEKVKQGCKECL